MRKAQTNERGRTIQRLEKVLQDAGIKLSSVASHTYSKSARAMLEALLCGVTDPDELAELSKARMRLKIPPLREALASRFQIEHHGILVAQLLAHIDTLDAALANLTERIEFGLEPRAEIIELLCTIPGVQAHAAQVLIAECGLDMTQFPTVGHFASWAGAWPRPQRVSRATPLRTDSPRPHLAHQPADRMREGCRAHQEHVSRRPLPPAPRTTRRTESDRRDPPRPPHRLLPHRPRPSPFRELGPDWQRKRYSVEHRANRLQRQLEALGYAVTLDQVEPPQAEQAI